MSEQIIARFFKYVDQSGGPAACWNWTGARDRAGYGVFTIKHECIKAHRFSYGISKGEPYGDILHKCGNASCCNPAHLSVGDDKENAADRISHGTNAARERNGRAVLDSRSVARMRAERESGATIRELSARFGVGTSQVCRIVSGAHWRTP